MVTRLAEFFHRVRTGFVEAFDHTSWVTTTRRAQRRWLAPRTVTATVRFVPSCVHVLGLNPAAVSTSKSGRRFALVGGGQRTVIGVWNHANAEGADFDVK